MVWSTRGMMGKLTQNEIQKIVLVTHFPIAPRDKALVAVPLVQQCVSNKQKCVETL